MTNMTKEEILIQSKLNTEPKTVDAKSNNNDIQLKKKYSILKKTFSD